MSEKINLPLTNLDSSPSAKYELNILQSLSIAPYTIDIDRHNLRVRVKMPRFNLCFQLKADNARKIFNQLQTTHNYYYWPSVFILAPSPIPTELIMAKHKISLTSIFYLMNQINSYQTIYELSPVVENLYVKLFNRFEKILEKSTAQHSYLSYV